MPARLGHAPIEDVILSLDAYAGQLVFTALRDGHQEVEGARVGSNFWARLMAFPATHLPDDCGRGADWTRLPLEARTTALAEFALQGAALFREMIPDPENRAIFRALLAPDLTGAAPRIRAAAQAALVPWEALCLVEADEPPTYVDFLGYRHVIVRDTAPMVPRKDRGDGPRTARRVLYRMIREAHGVEDDTLPTVQLAHAKVARERYAGATYRTLPPLTQMPQDLQVFHDFLFPEDYQLDLVHFDCHVNLEDRRPDSQVQVTNKFAIPFAEFEADKMSLAHLPVVVFNGCHGGSIGPGEVISLASRLRIAGAASVIAGECAVGDDFCLQFAQTFYSVANHAGDIGAALLETRQRFLGFDHNPLCLFFGLYGGADIELDMEGCLTPEPGSMLAQRLAWSAPGGASS
jgi:hypothetical protein